MSKHQHELEYCQTPQDFAREYGNWQVRCTKCDYKSYLIDKPPIFNRVDEFTKPSKDKLDTILYNLLNTFDAYNEYIDDNVQDEICFIIAKRQIQEYILSIIGEDELEYPDYEFSVKFPLIVRNNFRQELRNKVKGE